MAIETPNTFQSRQPVALPDNPAPVYPPALLVRALPPVSVTVNLRVDADGRIFASEALHKRLEYLGKAPEIVVVQ